VSVVKRHTSVEFQHGVVSKFQYPALYRARLKPFVNRVHIDSTLTKYLLFYVLTDMSKAEEKIRSVLKEYLDEKSDRLERDIVGKITGVFIWGTLVGAVLAYTNILPVFFGMTIGFAIAKKDIPIVNTLLIKAVNMLLISYHYAGELGRRVDKNAVEKQTFIQSAMEKVAEM
jgi:hypothetical protein